MPDTKLVASFGDEGEDSYETPMYHVAGDWIACGYKENEYGILYKTDYHGIWIYNHGVILVGKANDRLVSELTSPSARF